MVSLALASCTLHAEKLDFSFKNPYSGADFSNPVKLINISK